MVISQDESKLVAIFVQSILYGGFVVMFILTCWVFVYRRSPCRRLNKAMLGASITMMILATIHIIINFVRFRQAFMGYESTSGSYWNQLSEPTQILGSTVYITQTIVGDGVALYRCYIVWSRRLLYIIVPTLAYAGSIAAGTGTLVAFGKFTHVEIFYFQQWIVAFFSCTLATSTICTLMIAARIWNLNRGSLQPVMRIILESGAIYSGTLILLLVLFEIKSWLQYVVVDALSPIIGLVFSVIIVRVSLGISTDGPLSSENTAFHDHRNHHIESGTHTHPHPPPSHPSRLSSTPSPSRLWPVQPNRPVNPSRGGRRKQTIGFSFWNTRRGQGQTHYNLRSQTEHPSSYFRASEDMEIDTELEFEIEEARYRQPKTLPVALILPRPGQDLGR